MPKNKKQKTNHHDPSNIILSQAEIWDDSALIRSWEEARKEYEYYHSLAARGIDPDSLLDAAEEAEANGEPIPLGLNHSNNEVEEGEVDEAEFQEIQPTEGSTENGFIPSQAGLTATPHPPKHHPSLAGKAFIGPDPPPTSHMGTKTSREAATAANANTGDSSVAASAVNHLDETLENLKMAYYWAGYYSGLYDGQQQAQQQGDSKDEQR